MNKCRVPEIGDALYICSFANAWADRVQICKYKGRPLFRKEKTFPEPEKKRKWSWSITPGVDAVHHVCEHNDSG
jgi:hypothetical protein